MADESLFRIISLIVLMVAAGLLWYKIKLGEFTGDDAADTEQQQAKKKAVKFSVVIGVIYMVLVLGVSGMM